MSQSPQNSLLTGLYPKVRQVIFLDWEGPAAAGYHHAMFINGDWVDARAKGARSPC